MKNAQELQQLKIKNTIPINGYAPSTQINQKLKVDKKENNLKRNNMKTVVEFLKTQYNKNGKLTAVDFYQAEELHKEQIIDAILINRNITSQITFKDAEQYYNETFNK